MPDESADARFLPPRNTVPAEPAGVHHGLVVPPPRIGSGTPAPPAADPGLVTVTLHITNTYEYYGEHITVVETTVPAPPAGPGSQQYDDWAYQHIYGETGVGYPDGDSWYDVVITGSSDPELVGRTFNWGY